MSLCALGCVRWGDEPYLQRQNAPSQAQALTRIPAHTSCTIVANVQYPTAGEIDRLTPREPGECLSGPSRSRSAPSESDHTACRSRPPLPSFETVAVLPVLGVLGTRPDRLCVRQ
jgi:hypothetical protein